MKRHLWILLTLFLLAGARPAAAEQRYIVRTNLGLPLLQGVCLVHGCNVVQSLDGDVNQLFLVTTSDHVDPNIFLALLRLVPGILDAEVDQLLRLGSGEQKTALPPGLPAQMPAEYYGNVVWYGYAYQTATQIIRLGEAQRTYGVKGSVIVADIDTGVDPTHPALRGALLLGYDFTRNTPGGSELSDLTSAPAATSSSSSSSSCGLLALLGCASPSASSSPQPTGDVTQSSAAVLDQSSAAVLDGGPYAAFGHGTMVAGIIHLVAPGAKIMPLKSFHADGTGYLSDILRAVYYAQQNKARVINMSFDFTNYSGELARAINSASRLGIICVASAGNDGKDEMVYPAALTNVVMGIASTSNADTRSTFSNYGTNLVWMAAPGESIFTTYPLGNYASGSGTSFSSPFVAGAAALLLDEKSNLNEQSASQALSHAKRLTSDLGYGRLDICLALQSLVVLE
jgi:subtilisin family serine protease